MPSNEPAKAAVTAILDEIHVEAHQLRAGWDNWPVTYGVVTELAKTLARGVETMAVTDLKAIRAAAVLLMAHVHQQTPADAEAAALLSRLTGGKYDG